MQKRLFVRSDKKTTCYIICQYVEENGPASKSKLKYELHRPYSRVREAVNWLHKHRILKRESIQGKVHVNPGKREEFYSINNESWREVIWDRDQIEMFDRRDRLINELNNIIANLRDINYGMLQLFVTQRTWEGQRYRVEWDTIKKVVTILCLVLCDEPKALKKVFEKSEPYGIYRIIEDIPSDIQIRLSEINEWLNMPSGKNKDRKSKEMAEKWADIRLRNIKERWKYES